MPSLDLISMESEENPLLCLIEKRMEVWSDSDDDSVLSENSLDSTSSKKRRLSNDLYPLESPATAALEEFLSFGADETAFLDPLDISESLRKPMIFKLSPISPLSKSKAVPSLLDVTRGMSQVSASY